MHRRQCRVVRNSIDGSVGRQHAGSGKRPQASESVFDALDDRRLDAGVLQAHGQIVGARAAGKHHRIRLVGELFEIDIPNPRNVAAISYLVVDEEGHHLGAPVGFHDLQVLVEARGVLRQVQQHVATTQTVTLQTAVARVESILGPLEIGRGNAHLAAKGIGGHKIVGGVGRRLRRMHRFAAGRPADLHGHASGPDGDVAPGEVQRRAREVALVAEIVAELTVLAVMVAHHAVALLAHLGVGDGVLGQAHRLAQTIGDRVVGHLVGNAGAQRVVGVVHEHGVRRGGQRACNGRLDAVDFAAAVELVAEQIQQQHVVRVQMRQHMGKPQLVAFEDAPLGGRLLQKRRGNAGGQIGPGAVADNSASSGFKGIGQKVVRRGLPVGTHCDDRTLRALAAQLIKQRRINLERDLPRQVGRRTVRHMAQPPGRNGTGRLRKRKPQAHTRTSLLLRGDGRADCRTQASRTIQFQFTLPVFSMTTSIALEHPPPPRPTAFPD